MPALPVRLAGAVRLPRLRGAPLRLLLPLAESRVGGALLSRIYAASYGMPALAALSDGAVATPGGPEPLAGAPPRRWTDLGLGPPPVRPGTGAALRQTWTSRRSDPVAALDRVVQRLERRDLGQAGESPFRSFDVGPAREAAANAADRLRQGRSLGPLDGLPVAIKDEHRLAGAATGCGALHPQPSNGEDSFAVARLRRAGATLITGAHTTEWGMSPLGLNHRLPLPRNPWGGGRAAGGSSTGSAVAVALGMVPSALGSDGGGSIRIPAAWCGIFGLKPSFGLIGRTGDLVVGGGALGVIGPLGAGTSDLVDLLEVLAAEVDPADPICARALDRSAAVAALRPALGRGVRGARIGVLRRLFEDADPGVARVLEGGLRALEGEGAVLHDVELPLAEHASALGVLLVSMSALEGLREPWEQARGDMNAELRLQLAMFDRLPPRDLIRALDLWPALRRQTATLMAGLDLLALPATLDPPPILPGPRDTTPVALEAENRRASQACFLANLTGLPAGTAPVGLDRGLPVGLQLLGDAFDEPSVLAGLAALERVGLADGTHPPGWSPLDG